MFSRFLAFLIAGVITALLNGRGAFVTLDSRIDDGLLALAAASERTPKKERVRVFFAKSADGTGRFEVREIVAALEEFGSRESSAAVVSLPPLPRLSAAEAAAIRGALFSLGRVVLVLDRGDASAPDAARLDRIGKGPDLPTAPKVDAIDSRLISGLPTLAIFDLEEDADGIVRRFAVAHGPRKATVPSLPVAIAARALHETSLRLSTDLRTLESFGARDLPLAGRNEVRIRPRCEGEFSMRALGDAREPNDGKRPPVRILAFQDAALARRCRTAFGGERVAAEVVAGVVDDLLRSRTLRSPRPRTTAAAIVITPPLLATSTTYPRSRRRRILAIGGAIVAAFTFVAIAAMNGVLWPIAAFTIALGLGGIIESGWRRFGSIRR